MKSLFVVLLLLCVLALTAVSAELLNSAQPYSESEIQRLWTVFTRKFEKRYGSLEAARRMRIFRENIETARKLNIQQLSQASNAADAQVYGLTRFMDLTAEEFKKSYLMSDRTAEQMRDHTVRLASVPATLKDLPSSVDWRTKGAVTPVKNQGSCGSCWAFSTTGNLEGQWFIKKGQLLSLSEQQLVDCDHECDPQSPKDCDAGCNGGLMLNAFQYVKKNGITTEDKYPYTAHDGSCKASNGTDAAVRITDSVQLPTDETQIAQYLSENGPLAVALNAEWLQFYFGGISNPLTCNPKSLNHGVLMVGYGSDNGKDYWIVKNSWGAGWGEHGYFRMIRGKGKCGINTYVVSGLI